MALEEAVKCVFCQIHRREIQAHIVYQDGGLVGFLDNNPLFPGHVLLTPSEHYPTLMDLPPALACEAMLKTQLLAKAVEAAVEAEGSFIAVNNRISQSVPHLHVHIVPRRKRDGLKGFFWPRQKYKDDAAMASVRDAIKRELARLQS